MSEQEREDKLLTVKEVAILTGLAVGTIYHLVSQRRIPTTKLSKRCLRFKRDHITEWINKHSVKEGVNQCKN